MAEGKDFIREIIDNDIKNNKNSGWIITRFPPEPNGYLHIGHAKSIHLNFGIAKEYSPKSRCHLRFDDTNPTKENIEYIEAIKRDIKWLGYDWGEYLYYASDYFDKLYEFAIILIKKGKAYVDDLSAEEIKEYRGTLTEPGRESPFRNRSVEENLRLFEAMKNGEFESGEKVLRAKIDMASPNLNMRDPVIYRIIKQRHHRTGDKWCIYPMYDFAHPLSDAIEGITHSLCTLEFEDHRPLYDWFIREVGTECVPQQIEFARLNLTNTVMSKRKLSNLVKEGKVSGWDDPRMPTISGLRRRGYTPTSIKTFCDKIGIAKANSEVDIALLEYCIREELNKTALRRMVVLDPIKVVITNWPDNKVEEVEAINNPEDLCAGSRILRFGKVIYIERSDFMEDPPKKYFRLSPGREVRLKHAYYIKCIDVIKDNNGNIVELHCTYDPESRGGTTPDGRKVRGTLHWVYLDDAIPIEVRLYDYLMIKNEDGEYIFNEKSMNIFKKALAEPHLKEAKVGDKFQFLRHGYFVVDSDTTDKKQVFNRIVSLKDTWAKIQKKLKGK